jgi:hypothetical protein
LIDLISGSSIFIIAVLLMVFALAFFLHSPIIPIMLILILFGIENILPAGLPHAQLGRFNINLLDVLSALMVATAFIRLFLSRSKPRHNYIYLMLALGSLLAVSLIRGISLFGLEAATNNFRNYLFFFSSAFITISLQYKEKLLLRFIFWWGIIAWVLFGLALWRWGMVALGLSQNPGWIAPGGLMTRVLNATQTFYLLQTLVLSWVFRKQKGILPFQRLMPYAMIPAIILLQQRTVWVIFLFLLLCIFLLIRQIRPVFLFTILAIILLGIMVLLVIWGNPLLDSLAGSALNMRNFEWRLAGWQALLSPDRYQNDIDYAIGQPFGTGYERYLFGSSYAVLFTPHNFYVQTFLNIGGFGLFILLLTYFGTLKSLLINRQDRLKLVFVLILISQLLFFMTYAPSYEQGIMLGFAILLSGLNNQLKAAP